MFIDRSLISDGRKEMVHFDKITSRIQKLCYGLNQDFVDPVSNFGYSIVVINHNCLGDIGHVSI